ncbi:MAG: 10 kDa chaperonin [Oligoflexia bacterium]|nr:MAG: 10 kDa chaperonin [Oligoflexia bacterium]
MDLSAIISPLDNRIIVQLETGERISPGGIILPDTSEMSGNQKGIVVAVGRGRRDSKGKIHPLDVQIGDKVMMSEHAGDSIEILGQKVRILRETDVLGVVQS